MKLISSILLYIVSGFIANIAFSQPADLEIASIEGLTEQEVARIVLPQIYQKIGKKITIHPLPANRAQYEANEGIKAGEALRIYTYGDENKNQIRVPTPYYSLDTAVFSLKKNQITINDKNDLAKYKIGKIIGVKHTNNITRGLQKVYNSKSTDRLFQQLLIGNIDIALTNFSNGKSKMNKAKFSEIEVVNPSLEQLDLFHYLHKSHQNLVEPINQIIKQLKTNGELAKMLSQAEKIIIE
jgi:polar amino acid transport system substrate-binding protein